MHFTAFCLIVGAKKSMSIKNRKNRIIFEIITLGCKVNQYDSAVLKNLLLSGNFILSKNNQRSDLIIVNSCAVTKSAISKSRKVINQIKKENPRVKMALIGCWPKVYGSEILGKELGVDIVLGEKDLKKINKSINQFFFPKNNNKKGVISCQNNKINTVEDRSRYFIKIQDGCRQFCSYCIIPLARGPLNSRSCLEILKEIKVAVKKGFEEIVLSGIHLGLYGKDLPVGGESLYSLLLKILKIKNIGRIRLSSIEINDIGDDIIDLMASNRKICRHLHIPLQSGNSRILRLMNRPYTSKYFIDKIKRIRKKIPDIAISTDIIVGFPGEGNVDFRDTYNFSKNIKFSKIHVFSFSAHEKTSAYYLPDPVSVSDIKFRSQQLRQLSKKLENNYRRETLKRGGRLSLLVEGLVGDKIIAKSEFYFDMILPLKGFNKKYLSNNPHDDKKIKTLETIGKLINYRLIDEQ